MLNYKINNELIDSCYGSNVIMLFNFHLIKEVLNVRTFLNDELIIYYKNNHDCIGRWKQKKIKNEK